MTDNEMIRELRAVAKKYERKHVFTFETNIHLMATDAANRIESLCDEINRQKAELNLAKKALIALAEQRTEVVRCKDCKHNVANWQHDTNDATDYTDITCDYFMTDGMEANDLCSRGERCEKFTEGEQDESKCAESNGREKA